MSLSPAALAAAPRIERTVVVSSAAAVTALAWLWLAHTATGGVSAWLVPHHHASGATSFVFGVAMWQAMMVAMMTPVVLRWLLTFATLTSGAGRAGWAGTVIRFGLGYFTVWLAYSVAAAVVQSALARFGLGDGMQGLTAMAGGAILIAAGALQFAPIKQACLDHCRNPLGYLLARWHNGPPAPFRVGFAHGAYCVGCCWALMATAFATGVMNMAWMALLTVVMAAEQTLPRGDRIGQASGLALAAWGLFLILR